MSRHTRRLAALRAASFIYLASGRRERAARANSASEQRERTSRAKRRERTARAKRREQAARADGACGRRVCREGEEVLRLLKIRLYLTPAYHPRGNYTERVNRFIGESLRTMLSMPGAKKADWWKLAKFIQFAYRRMLIPGTNVPPYMVARGRQPSLPSDLERFELGGALPTLPALSDHHYA